MEHRPGQFGADRRIAMPPSLAFSAPPADYFQTSNPAPPNAAAGITTAPSTQPPPAAKVGNGPALPPPPPVDPIRPRPEHPSQSPPSTAVRPSSVAITSPAPAPGVRYAECLKNHAASVGGHVVDGCCEFMPASDDPGSVEALRCDVCGCHRSFHRKEVDGDQHCASTPPPPPLAPAHHRLALPYYYYGAAHVANGALGSASHHHRHRRRGDSPPPGRSSRVHQQPPPILALPPPTSSQGRGQPPPLNPPPMTAFGVMASESSGGTTTESSSDEHEGPHTPGSSLQTPPGLPAGSYAAPPPPPASALSRKRFRTKFTGDQKDRMLAFADAIGWRMQRKDEGTVERFCAEVGVPRKVFKVWMHNNKHVSSVRKQQQQQGGTVSVGQAGHQHASGTMPHDQPAFLQQQQPAPPP